MVLSSKMLDDDLYNNKYWAAVGGVLSQYDGMQKGVELAGVALPSHWRWLLNGIGDLFQIIPAVDATARTDWSRMSREEKRAVSSRITCCTAD